jgi:hypothetical protein
MEAPSSELSKMSRGTQNMKNGRNTLVPSKMSYREQNMKYGRTTPTNAEMNSEARNMKIDATTMGVDENELWSIKSKKWTRRL